MGQSKKIGYCCGIDYTWELGEALGGVKVYASVEDLKEDHKCWKECGIVEVEVTKTKVIEKARRHKGSKDD
jgi:hypothetical protein